MSDEPTRDDSARDHRDDSGDREERESPNDREERDEPLGGVAEKVRDRAGQPRRSSDPRNREGPLADVATEVDERKRRDRDGTDAFESVEVGELDGEKLWQRLADEEGDGPSVTVPPGESVAVDEESPWEGRDVRTIPKETCHGCPHFGDPPELACTHEDTEILAMPDTDHFRVVDCPIVVEEEEIGSIAVGASVSDEDDAGDGTGVGATGTDPLDGTEPVDPANRPNDRDDSVDAE